jgi:hypothetical protein
MKMSQGAASYEDFELPFTSIIQQDYSGGMNAEDFEPDKTRYRDGRHVDTTRGDVISGPKATVIVTEVKTLDYAGSLETDLWAYYGSTYTEIATEYTPSVNIDVSAIKIIHIGEEKYNVLLNAKIYSDNAGSPGSVLGYGSMQIYEIDNGVYTINLNATVSLTGSTKYWIGVYTEYAAPLDGISYRARTKTGTTTKYKETTWKTISNKTLAFELQYTEGASSPMEVKYFEFKRSIYLIQSRSDGSQKLYINGCRGAGKSNSANKLLLNTDQDLSAFDLAGCVAMIIEGPGSKEEQPWRTIVSNTTTGTNDVITVDSPWKVTHTTATSWVVLKSDDWTEIASHGLTNKITDVAVTEDYVIFAQGADAKMRFMREYNNSGTWTRLFAVQADNYGPAANEGNYADFLETGTLMSGEIVLWRARIAQNAVDYSFIGTWDATGTPLTGTMLLFDINKSARDDLRIAREREREERAVEVAGNNDADVLRGIDRNIDDMTYQITYTATASFPPTPTTLRTGHRFLPYYVECGSKGSKITGLIMYGDPSIPHVLKEDSFGAINNNIYAEIPLGEMKALRSELNGTASMVHGVYLYFNMGKRIERYFESRLDDIGVDRDEGLPPERQGYVRKLLPYPGRYYALLYSADGVPSIVCNNGMGWNEIWRSTVVTADGSGATGQAAKFAYNVSNEAGGRCNDMIVQVIPGNNSDRLWFDHAGDIVRLPITVNPRTESYYEYRDLSQLETSWIYGNLKDVIKYWHSVKLHTENLSGDATTDQLIQIEYKLDNETTWTKAGIADTSPVEEIFLSNNYDVVGYRIKFRFTLHTAASTITPRMIALVIKGIIRVEVKKGWNVFVLSENEVDLLGNADYQGNVTTILDEWANSETLATPLLMRHNIEYYDNKRVFIDPASLSFQQVELQPDKSIPYRRYKELLNFTMYEV